jgi:hypothetical protein
MDRVGAGVVGKMGWDACVAQAGIGLPYVNIALGRLRRPLYPSMKPIDNGGRYWARTSDLFDEVGDRRGIPLGNPFPISSSRTGRARFHASGSPKG